MLKEPPKKLNIRMEELKEVEIGHDRSSYFEYYTVIPYEEIMKFHIGMSIVCGPDGMPKEDLEEKVFHIKKEEMVILEQLINKCIKVITFENLERHCYRFDGKLGDHFTKISMEDIKGNSYFSVFENQEGIENGVMKRSYYEMLRFCETIKKAGRLSEDKRTGIEKRPPVFSVNKENILELTGVKYSVTGGSGCIFYHNSRRICSVVREVLPYPDSMVYITDHTSKIMDDGWCSEFMNQTIVSGTTRYVLDVDHIEEIFRIVYIDVFRNTYELVFPDNEFRIWVQVDRDIYTFTNSNNDELLCQMKKCKHMDIDIPEELDYFDIQYYFQVYIKKDVDFEIAKGMMAFPMLV